jgi:hypothetical protein
VIEDALLEPWYFADVSERRGMELELRREIAPNHLHALFERVAECLARRRDCDDVLFGLDRGEVAVVHLTWSIERDPLWPATTIYPDMASWFEAMREDHEDFIREL